MITPSCAAASRPCSPTRRGSRSLGGRRKRAARARALQPDIVFMDSRMGEADDASGIDACRQIRDELPETQVIMFTSYGERESVLSSIMAGATGFLTKNVSHAQL